MLTRSRVGLALSLLAVLVLVAPAVAQTPAACPPLEIPAPAKGANLLTPEQEALLGAAEHERFAPQLDVIADPQLNAELQRVGQRLLAQLPHVPYQFHFTLVDAANVNAISAPGGYVYVSRRLALFVRSEDELAGLLAHEIGHAVTRQLAVQLSWEFRNDLNVESFTDDADLRKKYDQLLSYEANHFNPEAPAKVLAGSEQAQIEADRIAVELMSRAGYNPRAMRDAFDRLAELHGQAGNWLKDFVAPNPDAKRLRTILHDQKLLPAGCVAAQAPDEKAFVAWQANLKTSAMANDERSTAPAVADANGERNALPDFGKPLSQVRLTPPLLPTNFRLRFSPDGRHLLAEDAGGVDVLSRDPFQVLFRVSTRKAIDPHFSPDSRFLVFHTASLHVERWSIAERRRVAAQDIVSQPQGCPLSRLSPDGGVLACVTPGSRLVLLDVASGQPLLPPEPLPPLGGVVMLSLIRRTPLLTFEFSPDGHYLLASLFHQTFAWDVTARRRLKCPSVFNDRTSWRFLADGSLLGLDDFKKTGWAAFSFPDGRLLRDVKLSSLQIRGATAGSALLLHREGEPYTGIYDPATGKVLLTVEGPLDVYNDVAASEDRAGHLLLTRGLQHTIVAQLTMANPPLSGLQAGAVSADFAHLALSSEERGAVWNLATGRREIGVLGFNSAYLDGTTLLANFRAWGQKPPVLASVDVARQTAQVDTTLDKQWFARLAGKTLVLVKRLDAHKPSGPETVEGDDPQGKPRWSRLFKQSAPELRTDQAFVYMAWALNDDAIKPEMKDADADLKAKARQLRGKAFAFLIEVVDAESGAVRLKELVQPGFAIDLDQARLVGHRLVIDDDQGRTLVYDEQGNQVGTPYGTWLTASAQGDWVCIQEGERRLVLYRLSTLKKLASESFAAPVVYAAPSPDGRRLLVVGEDQTATTYDMSRMGRKPATAPALAVAAPASPKASTPPVQAR